MSPARGYAPYAFLFSFAVSFQTFAVLLLQCFLCIFIEMITDNIDCLPDFLCKCVTLCFCIHHFFHNHFFLSFWIPSRESFHWSLSGHYSFNQAQNGHVQFLRLPIYSLFIFACKKPCDHSTFLT